MSTLGHGAEMQRRIVNMLRADTTLMSPTGLLYPEYAPKLDSNDLRVYTVSARLPASAVFVRTLPRVLIEVAQMAHSYEQEDTAVLHGPVKLWVHTVVPENEEEAGELIDAYITTLVLSTWLSDARIIAGRLSLEGTRRRDRIDEFNGAWQFITGFGTPNAASLQ